MEMENALTRRIAPILAPLSVLALVLLFSHCARAAEDAARTIVALDVDYAAPVSEPGTSGGGGGALRVGRKLDLILVSLTPEIGGSYHHFSGPYDSKAYRGFVGGRVGIGKIFEPSAFAHVGVGRIESNVGGRTAAGFDAGIALDFTLLPLINLGAHASYNVFLPQGNDSAFNWYLLGVHVALEF